MKVYYYASGFDINNAFFSSLKTRLKEDIKDYKSIVYIPASLNLEKTLNKYMPAFTDHFKKIGIEFESIHLLTSDTDKTIAKELIRNASFIMLLGGDPYIQKDLCKKLDIENDLKEYNGVILGMSAGAMYMSKNIIIVPCSSEYNCFHIEEGLNLGGISIYPHNNFIGDTFPKEIINDEEITKSEDLIKVAKEYGEFYLLQDNYINEEITQVSLIRVSNNNIEILNDNNGRVWICTKDGINEYK